MATIFLVAAAACLGGGLIVACALQVMAARRTPPNPHSERPGEPARAVTESEDVAARPGGFGECGGDLTPSGTGMAKRRGAPRPFQSSHGMRRRWVFGAVGTSLLLLVALGVASWPDRSDDGHVTGDIAAALVADQNPRESIATHKSSRDTSLFKKAPDPCKLLGHVYLETVDLPFDRSPNGLQSKEWKSCSRKLTEVSVRAMPTSTKGGAESAAIREYLNSYAWYRTFDWFFTSGKIKSRFFSALSGPGDQAFTCYAAAEFDGHKTAGAVLFFRVRNILVRVDYGTYDPGEGNRNLSLNRAYNAALKINAALHD
ncbi:hypothetical protein ACQP1W_19000 [Spirillospora sp. CA-255316]